MKSPKKQLAEQRLQETLDHLWKLYDRDRGNSDIRNRLAEHYTPLVQRIARRYIRRYRLRETATAIGDALLLLVMRLIPDYDGQTDFRHWASSCIRKKMLLRRRLEAANCRQFNKGLAEEEDWPEIESRLVRPTEPGSDGRFADMTKALPGREAAMLWLRFCRQLTHREIGGAFRTTAVAVSKHIRRAIGELRTLAEKGA